MKISDRDKKLILFVLLVAIIALPIFLFINPRNKMTKELEEELVSLNSRYDELKKLNEKKPLYEQEIVRLNGERDGLIEEFPGGILTENTILFLRDVEKSDNHAVTSQLIKFADFEETPVTEASVDQNGNYVEGLTAVKSSIEVEYNGHYSGVVEFLNYIFTYEDKMILSSFSMELDKETNLIKGVFILDQYAITGNGKEVDQREIPSMLHGTNRLFDLIYDDEGNLKSYWRSKGVTDFDDQEIKEDNQE